MQRVPYSAPPKKRAPRRKGKQPYHPQVPPIPGGIHPQPAVQRPSRRKPRRSSRPDSRVLLLFGGAGALILGGFCLLVTLATFGLLYGSDQIMPGVHAAGVDISGMDESEAAAALAAAWEQQGILLRDGDRVWAVSPAELGISLDASATAQAAQEWGRSNGGVSNALNGLISGNVEIDPVLQVNLPQLTSYLQNVKSTIDLPPTNAGVRLQNGRAVAAPASPGRELNIPATIEQMSTNPGRELSDGEIDLQMLEIAPTVTDAGPLVAQANAILTSPFTVNAYDPIRDEWLSAWTAQPEEWATWLTAESASGSGLTLTLNNEGPSAFLQSNAQFGDERYIDVEKATAAMRSALAQGQTTVTIRVWHGPTSYTVQGGQTLASIAEEVGIPYPYIQAVNPDINTDALSVGQVLTLPSKDILVPLDPIPNKRIVIDRGDQHMWAYENGQVVFDWVVSTGISSSPTALGVFQIQSHDENAYGDQWDLYMPDFMGFYHPGPNMDLWNGFHGFPTRSGGYLLWTDDLGHPVTYGCVLLSLENAETLYNWAQEGVVVVVRA